jgi:hypothetical protein
MQESDRSAYHRRLVRVTETTANKASALKRSALAQ